ncbi:MDR family MFS transporter [Lactiplantibacillus songbeiensis]|uniref:MDR family MFS transporter n=1 Tax=Lactiplantibacillus songbeiensis TaxID=2559920 RepID=A0ABW4C4A5_9LACO|nr:MDR family MFS transporter [Lactiplantibacillus songbeiensis]
MQTTTEANQSSFIKIALILVIGALAPMLDTTMTNVAINTIMHDLNSTVDHVQWVTTSYILALGIVVPITGWASEHFSGKALYISGLIAFVLGSIVSGLATSINLLIMGRIIQGAAAGMIVPLVTTLIVKAAGGHNLGSLMAIVSLPAVLAPILGPTIGGFIIKVLDWHWIFYINIPLGLLSLGLLIWLMPRFTPAPSKKPLDIPSVVLIGGAFTALILGITKLSTSGTLTATNVYVPLLIGVALLAGYCIYALLRPNHALVSLKLFTYQSFSASSILLVLSGLIVNGAMFLLPLFLQNIRGLSVIWSGIYLIAQGLGLLITRSQIGKLTDRIGARWVVLAAIAVALAGTLPFAYFNASTPTWLILIVLFIRGIAQGGLTIPIMSDAYTGVPANLVSEATTASRMLQNIGGAFGTALLATAIQSQLNNTTMTLAHLNSAYQGAFMLTVVVTVIAAIPAWFLSHQASH